MKHYCNPMSRAATTIWMLEELDAPHEQIVLDIASAEQRSPEYLAINPMGKVPALVDGDAVVTEVAAICAYLADKFSEQLRATFGHRRARHVLSLPLRTRNDDRAALLADHTRDHAPQPRVRRLG